MKSVLNIKNIDHTKQPLFFGEDLNLQRYDKFKYPIFFELFKKQEEFFCHFHSSVTMMLKLLQYKRRKNNIIFILYVYTLRRESGRSSLGTHNQS